MDVRSYIAPSAFDRWDSSIRAAVEDQEDRTIGIYDVIGEDWWTGGGFTAKRMSAALRSLGKGPVTVAINSPGGDMFEGLAMYSMLREHPGEVTVKVMGIAASAASIIAMAGDHVQIARAGFLMIHNCWLMAAGNRHELREIADQLEPFDQAMADVYAARTGEDLKAMQKLMDSESYIGGSAAVSQGFADSLLDSDEIGKSDDSKSAFAVRRMEAALRASGMPKSEAMRLISQFKSSAGDPAGSGEGEPTEHGQRDAAGFTTTAALAANLTTIL
ncbi:Clp protease ClpP [Stenotrophomonas maltophilia]|nr:Clp protease ClpP [Stenotrophomonas maltophilia]